MGVVCGNSEQRRLGARWYGAEDVFLNIGQIVTIGVGVVCGASVIRRGAEVELPPGRRGIGNAQHGGGIAAIPRLRDSRNYGVRADSYRLCCEAIVGDRGS